MTELIPILGSDRVVVAEFAVSVTVPKLFVLPDRTLLIVRLASMSPVMGDNGGVVSSVISARSAYRFHIDSGEH